MLKNIKINKFLFNPYTRVYNSMSKTFKFLETKFYDSAVKTVCKLHDRIQKQTKCLNQTTIGSMF